MQSHPLEGARILKDIPYWKDEALLQTSYQVCRWHHERYDGSGYPDGLVGDETPIAAQVVALADVYDALISNRAYKEAYTHEKAVEMIRNGECGAFNPVLLKCLENISFELDKTLNKVSLEYRSEEETLRTVEYLLRKGNVDVSNGTLHRLEYERMKYRFFADMSQEIQFEYAVDSKLLIMTEAGAKALGVEEVTANPLKNEHIGSIVGENLLENIQKIITKCTPEQPIVQCEGDLVIHGEWRRCHVVCCSVWSQGKIPVITGYIGKLVDVREQPMLEVSLQQQVTQDSVTGLLNRSFAKTTAERRLQQQQEKDFVLAIFDVEHFRDANMKYGHIFGDALLKQVAKRLKDCTRDYDITARVGGDEFMVVMEDSEDNTQIMKRIVNTLSGKYQEFYISIRMGISRTKEVGREYDVLFHCADRALYTACYKQQEQMCFYDDSMKDKSSVISSIDREEKV
jgi:putative two-component system response regulator